MAVGSLATNLYGVPRFSNDADFVLQMGPEALIQLADRLGTQFHLDPQGSFESLTMTLRHILTPVGTSFRIELFHLSDDAYDQERFRRRQRIRMLNREVSALTVDDVIVTKVRWASIGRRAKDRDDAREVISAQSGRIDWSYVNAWCDQHGARQLLDEIRHSVPPV